MRKIEPIQTVFIFFLSLVCLLFVMHKSFAQTQSGSIGVVVEDSAGANKMSVNNDGSINVSGTITADTAGLAKDTSLQSIRSQLAAPLTVNATVVNLPVTQAVSASSLPLPSGAATAVNQSTQISALSTLITNTATNATAAKQDTGNASLSSIDSKLTSPIAVTNSSLPLPSGASTSANQSTQISALSSLITNTAINAAGSISNSTCITTSATTISAPANALGFVFETESSNTANVRWVVGSTASSTVGNLYEPGRDSGFIPLAADISCFSASGTQNVDVQWVKKQ